VLETYRGIPHLLDTWLVLTGMALPLVWFGYLLFSTQGPLWEDWMFWLFAVISVIAVLMLGSSLTKLLQGMSAAIKNAYIFTPDEFITIENNSVKSVNLAEIEALTYLETDKRLELWIDGRAQKLRVYNDYKANQLEKVFSQWKAQASPRFLANYAKPEFAYNSGGKSAGKWTVIAAAIVLGAGASFAAKGMNRSYDDEQTWKTSSAANTVQSYEDYKAGTRGAIMSRKLMGRFPSFSAN